MNERSTSGTDEIRRMIAAGAIDEAEGHALLAELAAAEARDRVIADELHARSRARRGLRLGTAAAIGAGLLALGALLAAAVLVPTLGSDPAADARAEAARLDLPEIDPAIERLEGELRRPGAEADYHRLAALYERRHALTGSEADPTRAARARARAERLERRDPMKGSLAVFAAVLVLLLLAGFAAGGMLLYNGLVTRDERVDERWAQVETALQRRLDLIPNLVETVRGYAAHERETLAAVTEARARAVGTLEGIGNEAPASPRTAERLAESQAQVAAALGRLLALSERYPDLKAAGNFLALQDQLEGTENRIAVERQRYNDAVRGYNQRLRTFPSNLVGGLFGYAPREYFESRLGAEEPVPVSFDEERT